MAKEAIFALFAIFLRNFKQIKENFPKAMRFLMEELYTIYEDADQMYRIGKKTMLHYAARREKKEEIEKLIKSTMLW